MRKTKIVGTIGPACIDYETMKKMVVAGLNVTRINLSHANVKDMNLIMKNIKRIRKELKVALPVMIDTRGPELRVKVFKDGSAEIVKGQQFIFTAKDIIGNEEMVSINMPDLVKEVKVGDKILAVNGLMSFKVVEVDGENIITKALTSGVISNRKSLSIPGIKFNTPYLNDADKKDILWAIDNDVDFVAISFVNSAADVETVRKFIKTNGGNLKIIAKVESLVGLDNLDEILDSADAMMVARGDLGVELPIEKLPNVQKQMISKANEKGKPIITATEMLESMINSMRPTRAEVSDVANAVYDGSSAIMLSGETAAGKHPVDVVKTMSKIAMETEKHIDYISEFKNKNYSLNNTTDVISHSAVSASYVQKMAAIVAFTYSGKTAELVSRFRPAVNIIGATPNEKIYRQMDLLWGVTPMLTPNFNTTDEMFDMVNDLIKKKNLARVNDKIVITCGTPNKGGGTNLIKVSSVK